MLRRFWNRGKSKGRENTVPWWPAIIIPIICVTSTWFRRAYGYQSRECFPDQSYPNPLERSQRHVSRYRGDQGLQNGAAKPCGNSNCPCGDFSINQDAGSAKKAARTIRVEDDEFAAFHAANRS